MDKFKSIYIILVTLLFDVLATYVVCDKFLMKKDDSKTLQTQSQDSLLPKEGTKQEVEKVEISADEKYQMFLDNLKEEVAGFDDYNYGEDFICNGMLEIPCYHVYLYKNGELYVDTHKISDHVLSYRVAFSGQGGSQNLYFIKEDGKVGSASYEINLANGSDEVTIVEDLGYKNIVNIIGGVFGQENTSGSHDPRFIDIEGHVFP